jgi:leucyl-tRNA synthetase
LKRLGLAEHAEPYKRRLNRSLILGPDGQKMSKSKGNVVDPDEHVERVGSDAVKMYLAFMGPYGEVGSYPFDLGGIAGIRRFLERVYGLSKHISDSEPSTTTAQLHRTVEKVGHDISDYKFNTAISAMMIFVNLAEKSGLTKDSYVTFLRVLAPFAPHLTEELWQMAGNTYSIHRESFPEFDQNLTKSEVVTIGVQVNGKLRGEITISPTASETEAWAAVQLDHGLVTKLSGLEIIKTIYIPNRILNIITVTGQ